MKVRISMTITVGDTLDDEKIESVVRQYAASLLAEDIEINHNPIVLRESRKETITKDPLGLPPEKSRHGGLSGAQTHSMKEFDPTPMKEGVDPIPQGKKVDLMDKNIFQGGGKKVTANENPTPSELEAARRKKWM